MQLRTVLLLVVALGMASGTAFLVQGWLAAHNKPTQVVQAEAPEVPKVEVLVTRKELLTGSFVKPEDLRWQLWPEEGVLDGYVVRGKASEKEFAGAVVRVRLYPGEPITAQRVIHPGQQGFLAAVLDPGKRAVAVPVDATSGVAGFVFPGDRVDVLLTLKSSVRPDEEEGGRAETRFFTQTLIPAVRVLGIDQTADSQGAGARVAKTATLEVEPKDAERIAVALRLGELSLALNPIARPEAETNGDGLHLAAVPPQNINKRSGVNGTYTRDADVLDMMGDPLGLPYPNGFGPKVRIVRGGESKVVRF